ncbi:MAG: PilZ domain-containing protein [Alphaproteobacteria bacterium]
MENQSRSTALIGCDAKLIHGGQWARCRLTEISPTGVQFEMEESLEVGERVVACIADVGAIAGEVAQSSNGRCSIAFLGGSSVIGDQMAGCYTRV